MWRVPYPKDVALRDGRNAVIRPLQHDDHDALLGFLEDLTDEDRLFLRHDVRDPTTARRWLEDLEAGRSLPLLALDGDEVVGIGRLHVMTHGWMQHVGHIRLITARSHRQQGLGGLLARELVALADQYDLEKIQAHVIQDSAGAMRMFQAIGFKVGAVLEGMVKDQCGNRRNLAILINDVSNLTRLMEDWIQDSIQPAYRVPGGGC